MRAYRIWANLVVLGPFHRPFVCVPDAWCTCRAGERRPRLGVGRAGLAVCVCLTRGALAVQFRARREHTRSTRYPQRPLHRYIWNRQHRQHFIATMDFTLYANQNGPSDPANVTLRGADPLFSLPAGHALRRAGLNLQATPGGLNASLDNAFSSEVEDEGKHTYLA